MSFATPRTASAGRLHPKKSGELSEINHSGGGLTPQQTEHKTAIGRLCNRLNPAITICSVVQKPRPAQADSGRLSTVSRRHRNPPTPVGSRRVLARLAAAHGAAGIHASDCGPSSPLCSPSIIGVAALDRFLGVFFASNVSLLLFRNLRVASLQKVLCDANGMASRQ